MSGMLSFVVFVKSLLFIFFINPRKPIKQKLLKRQYIFVDGLSNIVGITGTSVNQCLSLVKQSHFVQSD